MENPLQEVEKQLKQLADRLDAADSAAESLDRTIGKIGDRVQSFSNLNANILGLDVLLRELDTDFDARLRSRIDGINSTIGAVRTDNLTSLTGYLRESSRVIEGLDVAKASLVADALKRISVASNMPSSIKLPTFTNLNADLAKLREQVERIDKLDTSLTRAGNPLRNLSGYLSNAAKSAEKFVKSYELIEPAVQSMTDFGRAAEFAFAQLDASNIAIFDLTVNRLNEIILKLRQINGIQPTITFDEDPAFQRSGYRSSGADVADNLSRIRPSYQTSTDNDAVEIATADATNKVPRSIERLIERVQIDIDGVQNKLEKYGRRFADSFKSALPAQLTNIDDYERIYDSFSNKLRKIFKLNTATLPPDVPADEAAQASFQRSSGEKLQTASQNQQGGFFSIARRFLDSNAENYRNFQFITSQMGAFYNGLRGVLYGFDVGGIAGALDGFAGALKGFNAVVQVDKKYNLGILPESVGSLYTAGRTQSAIDLIEVLVGGITGVRPRDKQSRDKDSGVSAGKEADLTYNERQALAAKQRKEQEKERKALEKERKEQERKEALISGDGIKQRPPEQLRKSYVRQREDIERRTLTGELTPQERTREDLRSRMNIPEQQLANSITQSIRDAFGRSSISKKASEQGVAVLREEKLKQFVRDSGYTNIPDGPVDGVRLVDKRTGANAVIAKATKDMEASAQIISTSVHELAHDILIPSTADRTTAEQLLNERKADIRENNPIRSQALRRSLNPYRNYRDGDTEFDKVQTDYLKQDIATIAGRAGESKEEFKRRTGEALDYTLSLDEIAARIVQAHADGSKRALSGIKAIVGPKAYEEVRKYINEVDTSLLSEQAFGASQKALDATRRAFPRGQTPAFIFGIGKPKNDLETKERAYEYAQGIAEDTVSDDSKRFGNAVQKTVETILEAELDFRILGFEADALSKALEKAKKRFNTNLEDGGYALDDSIAGAAFGSKGVFVNPNLGGPRSEPVVSTALHEVGHALTYNISDAEKEAQRERLKTLQRINANAPASERAAMVDLAHMLPRERYDARDMLIGASVSIGNENFGMASDRYMSDADRVLASNYTHNLEEVYANVIQAITTGSRLLATALTVAYGKNFIRDVIDTIGTHVGLNDNDIQMAERFREITGVDNYRGYVFDDIPIDPTEAYNQVINEGASFQRAGRTVDDVKEDVTDYIGKLKTFGVDITQALEDNGGVFGKALVRNGVLQSTSSVGAIGRILERRGSGDLIDDALTTLRDPSEDKVQALVQKAKGSIGDVRTFVTDYIAEMSSMIDTNATGFEKLTNKLRTAVGVFSLGGISDDLTGVAKPDAIARRANRFVRTFYGNQAPDIDQQVIRDATRLTNQRVTGLQVNKIFDLAKGVDKLVASVELATGQVLELDYALDSFGQARLELPDRDTAFNRFKEEVITQFPRTITDEITYGTINQVQEVVRQLVDIQDELGEVANIFNATPANADYVKDRFLSRSIDTSVATGQNFQAGIETNIRNLKILGAVSDTTERENLANQLSKIQLGAQTVFGVTLEQSLENVPAILYSLEDSLASIEDPAERARQATGQLASIFDDMVAAQRKTGVEGEDLLTVYARLSASSRDYGLSSKELVSLSSNAAVALGRGAEETSNILRSLFEGIYSEANQSSFQRSGISTTVLREDGTIGNRDINDILAEIIALGNDQSKSVEYNNLVQSIAGPRLAPQLQQVLSSYERNNEGTLQAINGDTAGMFDQALSSRIENITSALNKLNSSGVRLFSTFVTGTGLLDSATSTLNNISESANFLSEAMQGSPDTVKNIADIALAIAKFKTIGTAAVGTNLFNPVKAALDKVTNAFENTGRELLTTARSTETGFTKVRKVAELLSSSFAELSMEMERTSRAAQTQQPNFQRGTQDTNRPTNAASQAQSVADSVLAATEKPKADRFATIRQIGAASSAIAPSVGFDLITGGFNGENFANVGVGIAGGMVGALGGPMGAAAGYSIAKYLADSLNFGDLLTFNRQEVTAGANALLGVTRNPTAGKTADELEQMRVANEIELKKYTSRARELVSDVLQDVDSIPSLQPPRNPRAVNYQPPITSANLRNYERFFIAGEGAQTPDDQAAFSYLSSNKELYEKTYQELAGNKQLLDAFINGEYDNLVQFRVQLSAIAEGKDNDLLSALTQLLKETDSQGIQAGDDLANTGKALTETADALIDSVRVRLELVKNSLSEQSNNLYGLTEYGPLGTVTREYDATYGARANDYRTGRWQGDEAERYFNQYQTGRESITALQESTQSFVPFARRNGLDIEGFQQQLYQIGAEGQRRLLQDFAQAFEADIFTRNYEATQREASRLQSSVLYGTDTKVQAEYQQLQRTLTAEKERYAISKQYLSSVVSQKDVLKQQAQILQQQATSGYWKQTSAGTPATFSAPNVIDVSMRSTDEIQAAIDYAKRKQAELVNLNSGYATEFAKQQFLINSGSQYAGVKGVDQSFFNEYFQTQQKQRIAPPDTVDLSKYSAQEVQKIIERARGLQDQAIQLAPDLAGEYDDERLLILQKNNELLLQTGLSQDFLRAAIDQNTDANNELRGHFNLPSGYRAPTVWDYYNDGGTTTGEVNFVPPPSNGVPLDLAKQIADAMVNGVTSTENKNPDLSALSGTTSGQNLTYYQGGSGPTYVWQEGTAPMMPPPELFNMNMYGPQAQSRTNIESARRDLDARDKAEALIAQQERQNALRTKPARFDAELPAQNPSTTAAISEKGAKDLWKLAGKAMSDAINIPGVDTVIYALIDSFSNASKGTKVSAAEFNKIASVLFGTSSTITSGNTALASALNGIVSSISAVPTGNGFTQVLDTAVALLAGKFRDIDLVKLLRESLTQSNVTIYVDGKPTQTKSVAVTGKTAASKASLGVNAAPATRKTKAE